MTYKTVMFDLDGTLADTSPGYIRAFQRLLVAHEQTPLDDDSIRETISDGARTTIRQAWSHDLSDDEVDAIRLSFLDLYAALPDIGSEPFNGMVALLQNLRAQGCKTAVITNKTRRLAPQVLASCGLTPWVDLLVCPEDVDSVKPHPAGIAFALSALDSTPHQTLYVGDHAKDIQTAHNAGVASVAVGYGFIPADEDPSTWGATFHAHTPADLKELIERLIVTEPL